MFTIYFTVIVDKLADLFCVFYIWKLFIKKKIFCDSLLVIHVLCEPSGEITKFHNKSENSVFLTLFFFFFSKWNIQSTSIIPMWDSGIFCSFIVFIYKIVRGYILIYMNVLVDI